MDEQASPARRSTMNTPTPQKRTLEALSHFLRLLAAFLCGWVAPWLLFQMGDIHLPALLSFYINFYSLSLLFPLALGIGAPLTVGRQNKHLILLSISTGLLAIAGIAAYGLPITIPADDRVNAQCAIYTCHVGGISTILLIAYLIYGVVIVLLSSVITSLIIKRIRKNRQRAFYRRSSAQAGEALARSVENWSRHLRE